MASARPTLKPRQISDLLSMLCDVTMEPLVVATWRKRHQKQCEGWCDFEINRLILGTLWHWPVGNSRKLPARALAYIEARRGIGYKRHFSPLDRKQQRSEHEREILLNRKSA